MESIAEKIRQIRKLKGISQTAVADACNIKQSSYANIESGKTQNITIDIGKGISRALGVSFNDIFEIETNFNEENNKKVDELLNEIDYLAKVVIKKDKIIDALIRLIEKQKTQ